MNSKLELRQTVGHVLSLKQIQLIKLLQVPGFQLADYIQQEIERNPLLEEDYETKQDDEIQDKEDDKTEDDFADELLNDDNNNYKMMGNSKTSQREEREIPIPASKTYIEDLQIQLGFITLSPEDYIIGSQIVGSIDENGYMRTELRSIVNDLILLHTIRTTEKHVESILKRIQTFSPPGVGARNLQECLLIQIKQVKADKDIKQIAIEILTDGFESFTKKHYKKIRTRLGVTNTQLKAAIGLIVSLNPKPIRSGNLINSSQYLRPDFLVSEVKGTLHVEFLDDAPIKLRLNRYYMNLLRQHRYNRKLDSKTKDTLAFIRYKLVAARTFMDAMHQRRNTLLNTMKAIVNFQQDFFRHGNFEYLKPMILNDVADVIKADISTISRVSNSKSVQTKFGVYMLKQLFSEGIPTLDGKLISSKKVRHTLKRLVNEEDKTQPLSDEELTALLASKGFKAARRTVAKYRKQMKIPVARLRRTL